MALMGPVRKPRRLPERRKRNVICAVYSKPGGGRKVLVVKRSGGGAIQSMLPKDRRALTPAARRSLRKDGAVVGRAHELYSGVRRVRRGKK